MMSPNLNDEPVVNGMFVRSFGKKIDFNKEIHLV
jgi:hypothetical protein